MGLFEIKLSLSGNYNRVSVFFPSQRDFGKELSQSGILSLYRGLVTIWWANLFLEPAPRSAKLWVPLDAVASLRALPFFGDNSASRSLGFSSELFLKRGKEPVQGV